MQFALLGDHPDGLGMAQALVASGRHQLRLYAGPVQGLHTLKRFDLTPGTVADLEEVLADAAIELVIVASAPSVRATHLRRAIQADCHVMCVHPADPAPDIAYEASMIQTDTGCLLWPLLPMTCHPGIARLTKWTQVRSNEAIPPRILEMEVWSTEEVLLEASGEASRPGLPGWDVVRFIGGEISEVFLLTSAAELLAAQACVLSARFVDGGLIQATYLPNQSESRWRLSLVTTTGRVTLLFPQGWPGPAQLTYLDEQGESRTESWEAFHPWESMVEQFEQTLTMIRIKKREPGQPDTTNLTQSPARLGWQDELRALELDDAARRSAERGRSSTLEIQQATEEASFKGTMTLFGCSLIWLGLIVLILSVWVPYIGWLIVPVFGLFLLLQVLRWVIPASRAP